MTKPLLTYQLLDRVLGEHGERVTVSLGITPHLNGFASCQLTFEVPAVELLEEVESVVDDAPKAKGKKKAKAEARPASSAPQPDSTKRDAAIREKVAWKANVEVWGHRPPHGAPLWTPDEVVEVMNA